MPCLKEGIELIEKWGFSYKTVAFTWVKKNKVADSYFWGMGYWTRANSEICLLATKGSPKRVSKGVHQIVDAKITKHSEKPNDVRERIIRLCGDLPRLEMFARVKHEGWDVFGDEVSDSITIQSKVSV